MIQEPAPAMRLSDLRSAVPADPTLQSLLGILLEKLELCGRLPIFEHEAERAGHANSAAALRHLADVERQSFEDLLACLRAHLDAQSTGRKPA